MTININYLSHAAYTIASINSHSYLALPTPVLRLEKALVIMKLTVTLIVAICTVIRLNNAHISLSYPKARYPDYDFLDNIRTGGPCGVPDGMVAMQLFRSFLHSTGWALAIDNALASRGLVYSWPAITYICFNMC